MLFKVSKGVTPPILDNSLKSHQEQDETVSKF